MNIYIGDRCWSCYNGGSNKSREDESDLGVKEFNEWRERNK